MNAHLKIWLMFLETLSQMEKTLYQYRHFSGLWRPVKEMLKKYYNVKFPPDVMQRADTFFKQINMKLGEEKKLEVKFLKGKREQ